MSNKDKIKLIEARIIVLKGRLTDNKNIIQKLYRKMRQLGSVTPQVSSEVA